MKRLLALLAALALVLCGCGGRAPEPAPPTETEEDLSALYGTWVNQGQYTQGREFTETLILSEDGSARILLEYQGQDYADLEGEFFAAGGLLTVRYEDDTGQQQRSYTYELAGNLLRLTGNGKTVEYTRE